jgi:hypothetical protein
MATFIIDCPHCKAKVGAEEKGSGSNARWVEEANEPLGEKIYVGTCPKCDSLLVGRAEQIRFEGYEGEEYDEFSDIVRVYPKPVKRFSSYRIPKTATDSLDEADRSLQSNANTAATMMFGRALEAVCRDKLLTKDEIKAGKKIMLAAGIKQLHEKKIIDARLFDWSQHLHAFRNIAAHPDDDFSISRDDAEDLQAFVYAIVEYIYDLTERYEEFKERQAERKKPRKSAAEIFAGVIPKANE